jgi:lambda family phage portal protein
MGLRDDLRELAGAARSELESRLQGAARELRGERSALKWQGAKAPSRDSGWMRGGSDPNGALDGAQVALRARTQDAARNDRWLRQGHRRLAAYFSGLAPQSAVQEGPGVTAERAAQINTEVDQLWKEWSAECQTDGALDFLGVQHLAVRAMLDGGDAIIRLRARRPDDGLPVPFQLQVLEADLLDHRVTKELDGGGRIIQGVELDRLDRRVAYHLHKRHPRGADGWIRFGGAASDTVSRVPARDVIHLFDAIQVRPGQVRGVPNAHAVLQDLRDLSGYQDAVRVAARAAASFMAVIEADRDVDFDDDLPDGFNPVRDSDGNVVDRLRPGSFLYSFGGKRVTWNTPPKLDNAKGYLRQELQGIAAGLGLPAELLTGDLEGVNYSSIRFGLGAFRREVELFQALVLGPLFCAPIWARFVELARFAGTLPPEAGPVDWVSRPWPMVDAEKENRADLIAIRGGWMTLEDKIRATGKDPGKVMADQERLQAWAKETGVILDSNPAATTLSGQIQIDAETDSEPEDDSPPDSEEG